MTEELFIKILVIAALLCVGAYLSFAPSKIQKKVQKAQEQNRRGTPCRFRDSASRSAFEAAAKEAGKNIPGLQQLTVSGSVVHGVGLNPKTRVACHFDLDFNDSGAITGKYWKYCDDPNAGLPDFIGNRIQYALRDQLRIPNFKFEHVVMETPIQSKPASVSGTIAVAMVIACLFLLFWVISHR